MTRRLRLYLAATALATGCAVAIAPLATGHGAVCISGTPGMPSGGCVAATNNPDWILGFLVAVAAYIALVGIILLAQRPRKARELFQLK